jgi:hypothetical protein
MEACDAEQGVVHAAAFETAVAEDLPRLHTGEGVLDASSNLLMAVVVLLLPLAEVSAGCAAVRDDQAGALVAAVGDRCGRADGGLRPGLLPRLAVVAVAWHWHADGHDEAAVRVDDDLVVEYL